MQVEEDLKAAINIINSKKVDKREYKPVRILPNYSQKTFKNIKFNASNILSKCISISDILDLLCYSPNISCYSFNRLDEYFINLMIQFLNLTHHRYIENIFNRESIDQRNTYLKIRDNLDEKTRYFFDEIYKHIKCSNIFNTKLCNMTSYDYKLLERYVGHFLIERYAKACKNAKEKKVVFSLCKDSDLDSTFKENSFSFINLGYDISDMDEDRISYILDKTKSKVVPLLKESGKIKVFRSTRDIDLQDLLKIETRSIDDPNSKKDECKKEYVYVYRK